MSRRLLELTESAASAILNLKEIRDEIHSEHERATSTEQRVDLLALFKATMDIAEKTIAPEDLETFKKARLQDYRLLIIREALVGENVCTETLDATTQREVAAGRMDPNHELRKTAEMGMAAPHLSRDELLEIDAKKRALGTLTITPTVSSWRRALAWIRRG